MHPLLDNVLQKIYENRLHLSVWCKSTQYAHNVVLTSIQRRLSVMDVAQTSKRRRVLAGHRWQMIIFCAHYMSFLDLSLLKEMPIHQYFQWTRQPSFKTLISRCSRCTPYKIFFESYTTCLIMCRITTGKILQARTIQPPVQKHLQQGLLKDPTKPYKDFTPVNGKGGSRHKNLCMARFLGFLKRYFSN